jgi:glycosyltransferase involved in cell wall biosynthesis
MSKQKPFLTITIPSLNRIESFKKVIHSILKQTFTDYELLVVDDHSDDDIKGYIESLKSSKIRFIQNTKRQGFKKMMIQSLLEARGTYVMTLGNDDILCDKETLQNVHDSLSKKEVGLAKIGLIYYYKNPNVPCFSTKLENKDKYIENRDYDSFFKAIDDYGLTHIAGTIYLRKLLGKESFLDNELIPFYKTLVDCATQKGFLYIANAYIAVGISTSYLSLFSQKKTHKESWFYVMYHFYKKYLGEEKARKIISQKMREQIPFFIAIKNYVGMQEVRMLMSEFIIFDSSLRFYPKMYMSYIASAILPRSLFIFIRDYRYKKAADTFTPPKKYFNALKI